MLQNWKYGVNGFVDNKGGKDAQNIFVLTFFVSLPPPSHPPLPPPLPFLPSSSSPPLSLIPFFIAKNFNVSNPIHFSWLRLRIYHYLCPYKLSREERENSCKVKGRKIDLPSWGGGRAGGFTLENAKWSWNWHIFRQKVKKRLSN